MVYLIFVSSYLCISACICPVVHFKLHDLRILKSNTFSSNNLQDLWGVGHFWAHIRSGVDQCLLHIYVSFINYWNITLSTTVDNWTGSFILPLYWCLLWSLVILFSPQCMLFILRRLVKESSEDELAKWICKCHIKNRASYCCCKCIS